MQQQSFCIATIQLVSVARDMMRMPNEQIMMALFGRVVVSPVETFERISGYDWCGMVMSA